MSIARILSIAHPDEIDKNYNEIINLNDELLDGRIAKHNKFIVTPVTPFPYLQKELEIDDATVKATVKVEVESNIIEFDSSKPELERTHEEFIPLINADTLLYQDDIPDTITNWSFFNCLFGPERLIRTICRF